MRRPPFRSGYVALLGRPNVGKSTLLNGLLGEKISIVSERPQTTRTRILGIWSREGAGPSARDSRGGAQLVFLDTPGVHRGRDRLNRWMVEQALGVLSDVDVAVMVVDASAPPGPGDRFVAETIGRSSRPAVLALNKVDLLDPEGRARAAAGYRAIGSFRAAIDVSARTGEGIDALRECLVAAVPEGPEYFPPDQLTDLPERFVAAEIVREKVFERMREEIPYSVAVETDRFKEEQGRVRIECTLFVERESQKGMLIGKGGSALKAIGSDARAELERFLAAKVILKLWVKVQRDWTRDPKALERFGYATPPGGDR